MYHHICVSPPFLSTRLHAQIWSIYGQFMVNLSLGPHISNVSQRSEKMAIKWDAENGNAEIPRETKWENLRDIFIPSNVIETIVCKCHSNSGNKWEHQCRTVTDYTSMLLYGNHGENLGNVQKFLQQLWNQLGSPATQWYPTKWLRRKSSAPDSPVASAAFPGEFRPRLRAKLRTEK